MTRSSDVPFFGPPIPKEAVFDKNDEFRNFLLANLINAENAGHHSKKFNTVRTYSHICANTNTCAHIYTHIHTRAQTQYITRAYNIVGILVKKKRKTHNVSMQSMLTMKGAIAWTVSVLLNNEKVTDYLQLCICCEELYFMTYYVTYYYTVAKANNYG